MADDGYSQQLMRDNSLLPNFKVKVPQSSEQSHKTLLNYFKNALKLKSKAQVHLMGIQNPTDIFIPYPVVGRLKDIKSGLILYRIEPVDSVLSETSSEDIDEVSQQDDLTYEYREHYGLLGGDLDDDEDEEV
jgi:hypothetical protein